MSLFRRKRKETGASELFAATLFVVWKEIDERCARFYWPSVNTDVAGKISEHYESYICLLIRLFFAEMIQTGVLRADAKLYQEEYLDAVWNEGLKTALRNRVSTDDSFANSLARCLAAIEDYSRAYDKHRAEPFGQITTRYFSACEHFVDLVLGELKNTPIHTDVFHIANDMHGLVKTACLSAAKRFELTAV